MSAPSLRRVRAACAVAVLLLPGASCSPDRPAETGVRRSPPGPPDSAATGADEAETTSPSPQPFRPSPGLRLPRRPRPLADLLAKATRAAFRSARTWSETAGVLDRPPRALVLQALVVQRIVRTLAPRPALARAVLGRVPRTVRQQWAPALVAHRRLGALSAPDADPGSYATGRPRPPKLLLRHYAAARRRFGVPSPVLAAVNLVESSFGRARERSHAGAQGPMQFLPSTWAAYGLGGDINDPRDAILGAANYLSASGAPDDLEGALFAYNPSRLYVDAVSAYARIMERRPVAFYVLYCWQLYVRTAEGPRRLTGPGTRR